MRSGAVLAGIALVAAHAAALPLAVRGCRGADLEVTLRGAPVAAAFDLDGDVPAALAGAVERHVDGDGPGLRRARWRVRHRGGFVREVGAAQLVGPFQSPATPPCGARLVVGQRFLDDGAGTPGTVVAAVRAALERELVGLEAFPAGRFRRLGAVEIRWARFDDAAVDAALFGELAARAGAALAELWRTDGYARIRAVVELDRVTAEVTVALVPRLDGGRLTMTPFARAELSYGNRVVDWALDRLPVDRYVSKVIGDELDGAILQAFDPPPPLPLPGGRALRVDYCPGARIEVASNGHAALPLALAFDGPGASGALPPRLGPATPPAPAPDTQLAFDLDLDTVNALLYELWRTGLLDEQLAAAGLDRRFNDDPTVASLLTLRISPLTLALPPVVTPSPRGLVMAADLRVRLADGPAITPARVWGELDVALDAAPEVGLAALELSCEPDPGRLVPCYADLVAAMRARAGDARDVLSGVLIGILDDLFTGRRVAAPDTPAALVLGPPRTTAHAAGPTATVRIAVPARVEEVP